MRVTTNTLAVVVIKVSGEHIIITVLRNNNGLGFYPDETIRTLTVVTECGFVCLNDVSSCTGN